jgi:predicted  nucleic acid-binding Zn-ribbon protein
MEDMCREKHKQIDERFEKNDDRLNNHSERIKSLENYKSANEVEIRNLVEQIKNLVGTLKWMITSLVAMLAGFFIWYIQTIGR